MHLNWSTAQKGSRRPKPALLETKAVCCVWVQNEHKVFPWLWNVILRDFTENSTFLFVSFINSFTKFYILYFTLFTYQSTYFVDKILTYKFWSFSSFFKTKRYLRKKKITIFSRSWTIIYNLQRNLLFLWLVLGRFVSWNQKTHCAFCIILYLRFEDRSSEKLFHCFLCFIIASV